MVSSNLSWYQNHSILIYHVNVVESVNETKFSDRIGSVMHIVMKNIYQKRESRPHIPVSLVRVLLHD